MPHKGRLPAEEKVRLVEAYLSGTLGAASIHGKYGIDGRTLRERVRLYKVPGATGLHSAANNRKYEPKLNSKR